MGQKIGKTAILQNAKPFLNRTFCASAHKKKKKNLNPHIPFHTSAKEKYRITLGII